MATQSQDTTVVETHLPGTVNLLRFGPIRALIRWSGFPYVFQAILLAVFVTFAAISWNQFAPAGAPDKLFAKTNLVQLTIWGLWWPLMVWLAVLFGRIWCSICPLELVANVGERVGRRLGIRQWSPTRWLQAGFLIVVLYAVIQLLVAGIHLHRVPAYTSIFLWSLLAGALVVGLLFKDRTFCRAFCPVGLLLGTYGRGSMLAIRHGSTDTCESCEQKDCVEACNRTRWQGRSCPSLLNPARLNSSRDCLICGQCIKACQPDNMQLVLRTPFHRADARESLASWPVLLFVMLVSGFVTYELCTEWAAAKAVFLWVPEHLAGALQLAPDNGWVKGIWMLFLFPLALWTVLGGLVRITGAAASLSEAWRRLALPLVVLISAGHMAKGLAKFVSWAGFLPGALREPAGVETVQQLAAGSLPSPPHLMALTYVSVIVTILMIIATLFALREAWLANRARAVRLWVPLIMLAVFFTALTIGWGIGA